MVLTQEIHKTGFILTKLKFRHHCQKARFSTISLNLQVLDTINTGSSVGIREEVIALCRQGQLKEALNSLYLTNPKSFRLDSHTYSFLLEECLHKRALSEAKRVHTHMSESGFNLDIFLANKLIVLYAKCGSLADTRGVFDEMPVRNVASWTAMIQAYSKHGQDKEALELFCQMQKNGTQPDQFTFATILPACANLAVLEHGKKDMRKLGMLDGLQSSSRKCLNEMCSRGLRWLLDIPRLDALMRH